MGRPDEEQRNPGLYRSEQLQDLRTGAFALSASARENKYNLAEALGWTLINI